MIRMDSLCLLHLIFYILNTRRHIIPKTNCMHDQNISPVYFKTFLALYNIQNIQMTAGINGMNKYVCTYIIEILIKVTYKLIQNDRESQNKYRSYIVKTVVNRKCFFLYSLFK